jgi:hypothetical protein
MMAIACSPALSASSSVAAMDYCHCDSVPPLVGKPGQCFHPVETGGRKDHAGGGQHRNLQQDAEKLSQVVQDVWGPHLYRASAPGFIDVHAAIIPSLPFKPGLHAHHAETVLHIKDGLPKLKDIPKEMGGSGEVLPE